MNSFPVGAKVTVSVPFTDYNGTAITPTGVSYSVLDEDDEIVSGPTTVTNPDAPDAWTEIEVPALANASEGSRTVRVALTTALGVFYAETTYLIRAASRLAFLTNSFQTYGRAQLTAADMAGIDAFVTATPAAQSTALIEAYTRLIKFNYLINTPDNIDDQSIYRTTDAYRITPIMWPVMTEEMFVLYPDSFVTALRKAQIAEANEILDDNPITSRLRAGLMSETIGESSMMFRPGIRPLELAASRAALNYLKGYIDYSLTIARS
jgi:hypothetical protein